MKKLFFAASVGIGFLAGVLVGSVRGAAPPNKELPAYLVASQRIIHPDQLQAFSDAVVPLAQKAGWTPLAGARPEVFEGSWPDGSILFVQKYPSMEALRSFWRSPENNAVQKLREGHLRSDFVVAVEGQK